MLWREGLVAEPTRIERQRAHCLWRVDIGTEVIQIIIFYLSIQFESAKSTLAIIQCEGHRRDEANGVCGQMMTREEELIAQSMKQWTFHLKSSTTFSVPLLTEP